MQSVLVLGSNSLIGQKLIKLLALNDDFYVIATSKTRNKISEECNCIFEFVDVTRSIELVMLFEKYNPDIVVNLVAKASPDWCEENKVECWDTNVNAVENIVQLANQFESHLIHYSTDFIFDGIMGNYFEEDIPNPQNYYGLSKMESENILIRNSKKWTIIRTALVYGYEPEISRTNIVLSVKKNLEEGKKIHFAQDQFRTPTFADDIAQACVQIIKNQKLGIYHISGNEYMSVYEMTKIVAEYFALDSRLIIPINTVDLNEKAKRPFRTGMKTDKAYNEIGFSPIPITEALKIIKNQMNRYGKQD
ncbi:MAG TPA: NAD(P)-dependent oxidoreductase [Bacteroidales bacterium]|nr:MAG: hypothetical protein A2W98_10465 [Bacteroidetes bacterium GWF2_33_38]OFY73551.1 MAG: hypothetical protein A2265_00630 [Bacteroidetes bacterium RIFOXYA12_FULL_33_9]OFY87083.1 MAG: hypothetical protein A2236_02840 [Bacteroidetes bacterium RIFOXYA2_FULL_33_7]HBF87891.1 NAD(P)-dependent oxidoreductase [Bacteroidales bacterium]